MIPSAVLSRASVSPQASSQSAAPPNQKCVEQIFSASPRTWSRLKRYLYVSLKSLPIKLAFPQLKKNATNADCQDLKLRKVFKIKILGQGCGSEAELLPRVPEALDSTSRTLSKAAKPDFQSLSDGMPTVAV